MNQQIHKLRLSFLENNFRRSDAAERAYHAFKELKHQPQDLAYLLRHHKQRGIYEESEVSFRDDMDMLIGYYTILAAGIFSGYISVALDERTISELNEVLGHPAVVPYYAEYYPLTLPVYLYRLYQSPTPPSYKFEGNPITDQLFEQFMLLLRNRLNDADIDLYLWLLDDGYVREGDDYRVLNLRKFLEFIGNPVKAVQFKRDHPKSASYFDSAIAGFAKFVIYTEELEVLMRSIGEIDVLAKSAIWHVESYWFLYLHTKMAGGLETGLSVIANSDPLQYVFPFDETSSPEELEEWLRESSEALYRARNATSYVMDRSHRVALQMVMGDFDVEGSSA